MIAERVDHEFFAGETYPFSFEATDADGVGIDLTAHDLAMMVRARQTDADPLLSLTKGDGIELSENDSAIMCVVTFTLTRVQTLALWTALVARTDITALVADYDLCATLGSERAFYLYGKLKPRRSATR